MVVWGGAVPPSSTQTGGRYDPATDTWTPTSTEAGVPAPRLVHTAVWTGSRMIVWGGYDFTLGSVMATGGLYDPVSDAWTPTATASAPAARLQHRAVWTGSEMVLFGGFDGTTRIDTGGRYDPAADAWAATSTTGVPAPREYFQAEWTGAEMIVWGGSGSTEILRTGGRYDPWDDAWTATSTGAGVPSARRFHSSVWTGTQMIVWGGEPNTASGALYCGCAIPGTFYRDADGDAHGDASRPRGTCDGSTPAGYVAAASDCDDTDGDVHPGAEEVCNGVDDDCDLATDEGIPAPAGSPDVVEGKSGDATALSWGAVEGATGYDVVKGSLGALRDTAGDFEGATTACLADDHAATSLEDTAVPGIDQGLWYLVRAVHACGGPGSYDEGSGSQSGSRDSEIGASATACP
jgi:hypothetical protein